MTDKNNIHPTHQPHPPVRGSQHYKTLRQEITARQHSEPPPKQKDLFSMTITAANGKGENMDELSLNEQRFLIDLVFKPLDPALKLRPEEIQLILSYIGEILKELEDEESQR